ncbi:glycoside hydrolase family 78 protein [Rathayibacter sp. SD072]|uniref:glycoside hydrolase family 78 protein n=1 Tax=Rathayibacter sp. SD072 TaxID=2781731 RepID=UPI001A96F500|nr:glycoside hydrolase family 78 protein [Rathayibacter sp. SD072]MBO0982621.1 glycoside hydrolase family 78 protein [Rathayibacter sp. SD072]
MVEWTAHFVSAAQPSADGDPAVYFRRKIDINERPLHATLHVTALGIVDAFLNGERVGEEVLAPGWTSYTHRMHVSSYDVTDLVAEGGNVLGAVVGEGWAVGPLSWERKRHNYADRPAVLLQLELEYADRMVVIGTDSEVRVSTGGVRANGIYDGETFDARLEPAGWNRPGFDDNGWAAATPFDWDLTTAQGPLSPPIRRIEELPPVAITTSPSGRTIIDFGQILSGWVRLTTTGQAGDEIVLRFAEILTPAGELERETNRGAKATDRYILRGGDEETWEPRTTFHGFRYVEIDGWPGELAPDALCAVVVHTEMQRAGWFETSDPLVSKLHENTVWSMRGNFVGVPTDCPQRDERLGWTGDLNAFSPTAVFLYDVKEMLSSWLADLRAEQRVLGTVPWVVPNVAAQWTTPSATALWSDVAISLPWTLYSEYGDLEILRVSYDSMTSLFREIEAALDENGLWTTGFQWGDWLDPDAPASNPSGGKTDRYLLASAYLCKTSREIADTAALLGHDADAAHFRAVHDRVKAAFLHEYVTGSGRLVDDDAATAYSVAIVFDILDDVQKQRAGDRLAEIVTAADFRISTGFSGTPLVTHALSSTGHLDTAYRLLLEKEEPSFLYPVTMGATTIWERWDSVRPDGTVNATGMTSLNHYAPGTISDWLHRVIGGLERIDPGWKRFRIAPRPGGRLMWARTAHDTVHGRAAVEWHVNEGVMTLNATVPESTTCTVELPLHPDALVLDVGPGQHTWSYPAPNGYGEATRYTLDSSLDTLAADRAVWPEIEAVFAEHLPEVPLASALPHMGAMSLSAVIARLPVQVPGFEAALLDALATPANA